MTYEDVTNIDSVGLITARNGIVVGSGITLSKDGDIFATGVTTATKFVGDGSELTGVASTENIRTNTNATFLKNINVSGTATVGGVILGDGSDGDASLNRLKFGADGDLQIYHNQYHSKIADGGTGSLIISGSEIKFESEPSSTERFRIESAGNANFANNVNVSGIATVGSAVTISESGIEASGIGITVANINGTQVGGRRNLIDNGAMQVAQRGTYYPNVANNAITLDRFGLLHPYGDYFDVTQSTDSPDGFSKSYKLDINTVDSSIGSGQYVVIRQRIEAQNLQQLAFGTSAAKPITLSFYVRSNKTGTFAINIQQTDNSSKQVSAPYTISSANTWERKTFTFAGDTSGVINDDNGTGLTILWWLSAGSNYNSGTSRSTFTAFTDADSGVGCNVNILDNTSNNFYLTGVQLEVGSQATAFEHRSFGEELALCQRYFFKNINESGESGCNYAKAYSTSELFTSQRFPVAMRAAPTITAYGNAGTAGTVHKLGSPDKTYDSIDRQDVYGGMRFNKSGQWATGDTDMYSYTFQADAEL